MKFARSRAGAELNGKAGKREAIDFIYRLGVIALLGYFFWVATWGEFGFVSRIHAMDRVIVLEEKLDGLNDEHAALLNNTRRLSTEYLDLDLLDERARIVLSLIRKDEFFVP